MPEPVRSVLVFVNPARRGTAAVAHEVREVLQAHGVRSHWYEQLLTDTQRASAPPVPRRRTAGLILAIGGDGTLLDAFHRTWGSGVPLLGINAGTLGFLTSLPAGEVAASLPRILGGDYVPSPRQVLSGEIWRRGRRVQSVVALNEVVVNRGHQARVVRLEVSLEQRHLNSYLCDGLIVATATGSTGYSLSAGGPILSPASRALVLTPICAHSLTNRPLVMSEGEGPSIAIPEGSRGLLLQVDGLIHGRLQPGDCLRLRCAQRTAELAHLPEADFYSVLRQKLRWSGTAL